MHVLIVEDEQKMAKLLKKGPEEENHSANPAFDGRDALEMARAASWARNIKSHRKRLER
jgi:DNA-binding response OmpR family regulator